MEEELTVKKTAHKIRPKRRKSREMIKVGERGRVGGTKSRGIFLYN
jgi:hypothetical protein